MATTIAISHSVEVLSRREAISRPTGMCTTDSGSLTGSSAPAIRPVIPALTTDAAAAARDPCGAVARRRSRGEPATGCEPQDVGAHRLGVGGREVLQPDVAVQPRPDHLELGHADQAGEHRAGEVDPLHPVQRRAPVRAEQNAASHLDVVAGDAERVEPPRQVEQRDDHDQQDQHCHARDDQEVVGQDVVDRVAAAPPAPPRRRCRCRRRARAGTGTPAGRADSRSRCPR